MSYFSQSYRESKHAPSHDSRFDLKLLSERNVPRFMKHPSEENIVEMDRMFRGFSHQELDEVVERG